LKLYLASAQFYEQFSSSSSFDALNRGGGFTSFLMR